MKYTEKQARILLHLSQGGKIKHISTGCKDHRNLVLFEDGWRVYFHEADVKEMIDIADEVELMEKAYELIKIVNKEAVDYYEENRIRYR